MGPMITVLIPMYNRQQYIEECIRSVQSQSWTDLEILLIDDGSTDQTVALCQVLAEADARIRIVLSEHAGVSATRNKGLSLATGKYVFFLDSDDVIHPLLLETLVLSMEHHNVPMSGSQCQNVPERFWYKVPEVMARYTQLGTTVYKSHQEMLEAVFTTKTPFALIGGVMIRRDWIGQTQFRTDLFIGEDFYFIYENMLKGADVTFLEEKWCYWRQHETNSSWDFGYSGFMNRLYRRELVWKSEESFGRQKYANIQKAQIFGMYIRFLLKGKLTKADQQKIRQTMKVYKKALFPALPLVAKIVYSLLIYVPFITPVLLRILRLHKKFR